MKETGVFLCRLLRLAQALPIRKVSSYTTNSRDSLHLFVTRMDKFFGSSPHTGDWREVTAEAAGRAVDAAAAP